jgi:hypothetical protein
MKTRFRMTGATLALTACACFGLTSEAMAVGEAGAAFLKIPVGAREAAMGGTGTALASGSTTLRWNVAGLTAIADSRIDMLYGAWLEGMSFQHVGATKPMAGGVAGVSLLYSSAGEIAGFDANLNPEGDYTATDLAVTLGYARRLGATFSLGVAGTLIQQSIEEETATGMAVDIGLCVAPPAIPGLRAGVALRNLGPAMTFVDDPDPLPLTAALGASWRRGAFTISAEAARARGTDTVLRAGSEYWLLGALALRGGYMVRAEMDDGITAGIGIVWKCFELDYAFVPFGEINDSHHVGLTVRP